MTALVLGQDKTIGSFTKFSLEVLTLFDAKFCLHQINIAFLFILNKFTDAELPVCLDFFLFVINGVSEYSQTVTAGLAVIVTFQRYMATSRLLSTRQLKTLTRTVIVVVLICSFIIYIPDLLHDVTRAMIEYLNVGRKTIIILDQFLEQLNDLEVKVIVIKLILAYWLPLLLTVNFNVGLIVAIHRSSTFRWLQLQPGADDNRKNKSSRRVTMTVIKVVIVYLVCQLPMTVIRSWQAYRLVTVNYVGCEFVVKQHDCITPLYDISLCLTIISSLTLRFIFFLSGTRFRQLLIRTLLCRQNKDNK
jgi:hypothetical protein